jgi:hypothetical protein
VLPFSRENSRCIQVDHSHRSTPRSPGTTI